MSLFDKSDHSKPLVMLQYLFFIAVILYLGKSLFIPLSLGLLISFILYPFCKWLEQHKLPRFWAIFISLLVFILITSSIVFLLSYQFVQFMHEWPELSEKLTILIQQLDDRIANSWSKTFIDPDVGLLGSLISYVTEHVLPQVPAALYQSSISFVLFIIIPIFSGLILFYREVLVAFLFLIFPSNTEKYISKLMPEVIVTYYNFIKGMGLVYLIVGIFNSIGLFVLGVPNPIFFGFVASILTFIPYVGITIGAILPMTVSWIKYDSVFYPIGVMIVFIIVQIMEANIIFPLAVSQKLKINALITLVVIVAGGIIWGAMGMILFLPFVAILKLIADQVEEMKPISVLLGTKKDIRKM